jgi:hypothetical protein
MDMMNSRNFWAMLAPLWCGFLVTCAAAQPLEKSQTDLGAPGEEHKKLDVLAGVWEVTLKIPIGPGKHLDGKASCEAKWVMDGRFLRLEYSSHFAGKPLTVVRYLGFDRHKGKFVEVHFENTHTDVMHSEGDISQDGKTITCWGTHVDMATGTVVKVRTVTTLLDKDTFMLAMVYTNAEGADSKEITLTHRRKKGQ